MKKYFVFLGIALTLTLMVFKSEQAHDDFINTAQKYVVKLTNPEGNHGGTGFYVNTPSGNTYILTNEHICGIATNGVITVDNYYAAPVVAIYPKHDLCLVYNPTGHSGLNVAKSSKNGEDIYVIGHPQLLPKSTAKGQLTERVNIEVVMGMDLPNCTGSDRREQDYFGLGMLCVRSFDAGPTTANILPGNSGSPILDIYRHVVGVAFAGQEGSARGFIVPLSYVSDFLRSF